MIKRRIFLIFLLAIVYLNIKAEKYKVTYNATFHEANLPSCTNERISEMDILVTDGLSYEESYYLYWFPDAKDFVAPTLSYYYNTLPTALTYKEKRLLDMGCTDACCTALRKNALRNVAITNKSFYKISVEDYALISMVIDPFYSIAGSSIISCGTEPIRLTVFDSKIYESIRLQIKNKITGSTRLISKNILNNTDGTTTTYYVDIAYADLGLPSTEDWHNTELEIRVFYPDGNVSTSVIGGVFFLTAPVPKFGTAHQPSCAGKDDAYIPMKLPAMPKGLTTVKYQVMVKKYVNNNIVTADSFTDTSVIPNVTYYCLDGAGVDKDIDSIAIKDTIKIDNDFIQSGELVDITNSKFAITAGYYKVEAKYFDGNSALCAGETYVKVAQPDPIVISSPITPSVLKTGSDGTKYHILTSDGTGSTTFSISGRTAAQNTYKLISPTLTTPAVLTYNNNGTYTVSGLPKGASEINVKADLNSCPSTGGQSVTLVAPNKLEIPTPTSTNVLCNGGSTGTITYSISGGIPLFAIQLLDSNLAPISGRSSTRNNRNDSTFTNLPKGDYFIKVTDAGGIASYTTPKITITEPPKLSIGSTSISKISWPGANDGSITLNNVTGGTGSYKVTGGIQVPNVPYFAYEFKNLGVQTTKFYVTDINECSVNTNDIPFNDPTPIDFSVDCTHNETCKLGDGKLKVTISGGYTDYSYEVKLYKGDNQISFPKSMTVLANSTPRSVEFTNLTSGSDYSVKVFSTKNANNFIEKANTFYSVGNTNPIQNVLATTNKKDESCLNKSDASVEITGLNSLSVPYTFSGEGTFLNPKISNLTAGVKTFTFTETTGRKCTTTVQASMVVSPSATTFLIPPTETEPFITNTSCSGVSTGEVKISLKSSSAFSNFTYNIYKPDNSLKETIISATKDATFKTLTNATYKIEVTDSKGCTISKPVSIGANTNPVSFTATSVNTPCEIIERGSINLNSITRASGTTLYASLFQGTSTVPMVGKTNIEVSGTTISFSNLPAASYKVVVNDNNRCSSERESIVGNNNKLPTITSNNIELLACSTASNGAVEISATPGTTQTDPLTFEFTSYRTDGKSVTTTLIAKDKYKYSNLNIETYSVKVTEVNGCYSSYTSGVVLSPNILRIIGVTATPSSCATSNNGTIELSATGGKAFANGYDFSIVAPNVASQQKVLTAKFIKLPPSVNPYEVKVTDSEGCIASKQDINTKITISPSIFTYTGLATTSPATCTGLKGSIGITIQDPFNSSPYSYKLTESNVEKESGSTTSTTPSIDVEAGTYSLTVTSKELCSFTYPNIIVSEPSPIIVNTDPTDIADKGASTGIIDATFENGSNSYVYTLTNSSNTPFTAASSTANSCQYNNLPAGVYEFKLKDINNCMYFDNGLSEWYTQLITVAEPTTSLKLVATKTDFTCNNTNDGTITLTAQGGWGNYIFSITKPDNTTVYPSQGVTASLPEGNYTVTVTDAKLISRTSPLTIVNPLPFELDINSKTDATCTVKNNGSVNASVVNGLPYANGFHCYIKPLVGDTLGSKNIVSGNYSYNKLNKNNYTLWAEDKNGCLASKTFDIGAPDIVQINTRNNYIKAYNATSGTIEATITKGNQYYQYQWLKDGVSIESGYTTGNLHKQDLPAGRYILQIKDTANCMYEGSEWMSRNIELIQPESALQLTIKSDTSVSCKGLENGVVVLESVGGWANHTYSSDGVKYTSEAIFDSLMAGNYTFMVRDSSGIVNTLNHEIKEPSFALTAQLDRINNVKCNGESTGSIALTISGGNGGYQVSTNDLDWVAGNQALGLNANSYKMYVKDLRSCKTELSPFVITQPAAIIRIDTAKITESTCLTEDGSISVNYTGGTGNFKYNWSRLRLLSGSTSVIEQLPNLTTSSVSGIFSGHYFVSIVDDNLCNFDFDYNVNDKSDLVISKITTESVSCFGLSDGNATAYVVGGLPGYSYSWPSNKGGQNSATANGYIAGNYTLMVGDKNGCNTSLRFVISTPNPINYQLNQQIQPLCLGGTKGSIDVMATGGSPNYYYNWSNGSSQNRISSLNPANYQLTISDSHSCSETFNFSMSYQREVKPNLGADATICNSNSVSLDAGNFSSYAWSSSNGFTSSNQKVNLTNEGVYYLKVKDVDNCLGYDTISVNTVNLKIDKLNVTDISCYGFNNGAASIDVLPQGLNYSTLWSNGKTINTINTLSAGNYNVTINDIFGCSDTRTFKIIEPPILALSSRVYDPLCWGVANGEIVLDVKGGTKPYTFNWADGNQSSRRIDIDKGSFELHLLDANGCAINNTFDTNYQRTLTLDLGADRTMCKNNQIQLSPGIFSKYTWYNYAIKVSEDSTLVVNSSANINLLVEDEEGCLATDQMKITQSEVGFYPQFLCSSIVEVGDTLLIIEVSQPNPIETYFTIPLKHHIVEHTGATLMIVFDESGSGDIKLTASSADCQGETWKNILVLPNSGVDSPESESGYKGSNLTRLSLSPNPTEQDFNATIKLKEAAPITIYLVDISSGQILDIRNRTGSDEYLEPYSFFGSAILGVFVESGGERLGSKLVVY